MRERPELLRKFHEGFTRLQPVPFAAPLAHFLPPLTEALREYDRKGKLRATDGTSLQLDIVEPILLSWNKDADRKGSLAYHPKEFHRDAHGGRTKAEILDADPASAFQLHLTEHLRDIPRFGKANIIGGRPQLEAGREAREYLALLGTPPYDLEAGNTPEAELAHLLCHLRETEGELLDDYNSGSAAYCTGGWFPSRRCVPSVYFNRGDGRLHVAGSPGHAYLFDGVRSSVRVS